MDNFGQPSWQHCSSSYRRWACGQGAQTLTVQIDRDNVVYLFSVWPFLPTSKVRKAGAKESGSVQAAAALPT